jgi:hypothetical protein
MSFTKETLTKMELKDLAKIMDGKPEQKAEEAINIVK